jgi:hypothetical protein
MTKLRQYTEFPLQVQNYSPATGDYQVQVLPDPQRWGVIAPVNVNLNYSEIETALGDLAANQISIEDLVKLGQKLADRLLPGGTIRDTFCNLARQAEGVRLRLYLPDRPARLQSIPWEYTYLPLGPGSEPTNHFLALIPKISLVRHPPIARGVPEFSPSEGSVPMLVIMANPEVPGLPHLEQETEKEVLKEAISTLNEDGLTLNYEPPIEHATLAVLESSLARKPAIFYFSGHGRFDEGDSEGRLLLEGGAGKPGMVEVGAAQLGKWLAAAEVRMAVLSACQTSKVKAGRAVWEGVAPALSAAGVPAVVAMQFLVQDWAAIAFSRGFYRALAAGLSLDEAVSFGRLAILSQAGQKPGGGKDSIQWGIPTVYLQAGSGVLFPRTGKKGAETAKQVRGVIDLSFDELIGGASLSVWVGKVIRKDVSLRVKTIRGKVTLIDVDQLEGNLNAEITSVKGDRKKPTTLFKIDES